MGKKSRAQKRKAVPRAPVATRLPSTLLFQLPALEIARGYDGLFRGEPEPVLLFALFAGTRLLSREQIAFTRASALPQVLLPQADLIVRNKLPRSYDRVTLVCVALEHDSGHAVSSMYSALEKPFRAWRPTDAVPDPHDPGAPDWPQLEAHPVELLLDGIDWRLALRGDDVIAAALMAFPATASEHEVRLELRSPDGKNEWTARAQLTLR